MEKLRGEGIEREELRFNDFYYSFIFLVLFLFSSYLVMHLQGILLALDFTLQKLIYIDLMVFLET